MDFIMHYYKKHSYKKKNENYIKMIKKAVHHYNNKQNRLFISLFLILTLFFVFLFAFNFVPRITAQNSFNIESARSYLRNEVVLLDADMQIKFSAEVAEALENGIPLILVVEMQLFRERFLWRNIMIKESQRLFELRYHPLTNIHEVKNMATGDRYSFNSRQEAMSVLGVIRGAQLIEKKMLRPKSQYTIQIRTWLDISHLPLALRQVASLSASWHLKSAWYQWSINLQSDTEKQL